MSEILITANRLTDGSVLWLDADLSWDEDRSAAACFDDEAAHQALAAAEQSSQRNEVTAIYKIPLDGKTDKSARETIRALRGPTITPPQDIPN